jgi:uncharacterized damage-inducible protein DinB
MASLDMPRTSDPIDALLAHNLWATRLILQKCRGLTDEQFRREFPIGPADHGGLHAILTHIIGAMRRWADRIAGMDPVRPPIESWRPGYVQRPAHTPDELLTLLEEAHRDLTAAIAGARRQGLDREVTISFPAPASDGTTSISFTAGVAIASAAAHGHYHRAQCMNILRQLGIPGASLDVIDWQQAEEYGHLARTMAAIR